jgi:hypothetical protein
MSRRFMPSRGAGIKRVSEDKNLKSFLFAQQFAQKVIK